MVEKGEILEYAEYNGCYYGSIRKNVDALRAQGKNVVLKIEVQGAAQIRARGEFVTSVFILPPSMQELERRLRKPGHRRRGSHLQPFGHCQPGGKGRHRL